MSIFADCQDARNMTTIQEITCPKCQQPGGIEIFLKDGCTVGESICDNCGYKIPDGVNLKEFFT